MSSIVELQIVYRSIQVKQTGGEVGGNSDSPGSLLAGEKGKRVRVNVNDAVEQSSRVVVWRKGGSLTQTNKRGEKEIEIVKNPKKTDEKRGRKEVKCKE